MMMMMMMMMMWVVVVVVVMIMVIIMVVVVVMILCLNILLRRHTQKTVLVGSEMLGNHSHKNINLTKSLATLTAAETMQRQILGWYVGNVGNREVPILCWHMPVKG